MTLQTLRDLLALAHGPACEGKTKEEIVDAFLPRFTCWMGDTFSDCQTTRYTWNLVNQTAHGAAQADLTDPGTVGAIKTALALALGLDPGVGSLGIRWLQRRLHTYSGEHVGFYRFLTGLDGDRCHVLFAENQATANDFPLISDAIIAPAIATEPDPIKALVLACEHVIRARK